MLHPWQTVLAALSAALAAVAPFLPSPYSQTIALIAQAVAIVAKILELI